MAEYKGFKCDVCGEVFDLDERTVRTTKFEGPIIQGQYQTDLCVNCAEAPEGITLKPLRTRRPASPSNVTPLRNPEDSPPPLT